MAASLLTVLHEAVAPIAVQRLVITIFSWSWPWSIGLFYHSLEQLAWRADGESVDVVLDVQAELPRLPAVVEVATYRIATEALTNVVRHSKATKASVQVSADDHLEVSITDNGPPNGRWSPGVGLTAMRERVAELGGAFRAGPTPTGGQVVASFPLSAA